MFQLNNNSVAGGNNKNWIQVGSDMNGEAEYDLFGVSVALSVHGSILATGADSNDANGLVNSRHVRIYENSSGDWI